MEDWATAFGIWVGALLNIFLWSIAYRDNPLFKFAEHTYVGAAVGYAFAVAVRSVKVYGLDHIYGGEILYIIPFIIGFTLYFRYHKTLYWIYRYGMAIIVGTGIGAAFVRTIETSFLAQIRATASINLAQPDAFMVFSNVIFIVAVTTTLYYFVFTFPALHRGVGARIADAGRWFMMLAFGYAFAKTVVSRYNLMLGRLQFLLYDWLHLGG